MIVGVAQRLLMQRFVGSQQSAGVLHGSETNEQVFAGGGTHCSVGTPSAERDVSRQYPPQQSAPVSQDTPFVWHGASAANARMLAVRSSWPGR
jgi:hypothetical protein